MIIAIPRIGDAAPKAYFGVSMSVEKYFFRYEFIFFEN